MALDRQTRFSRFGPWLLGVAYVAAVAGLLCALVWGFVQQADVNRELCQAAVINREADRVQWTTLRGLLVSSSDDPIRQQAFRDLIAGVLRPIPPLECIDDKPVPIGG